MHMLGINVAYPFWFSLSWMLKNAFLAFFNAPGAALVRTRLRRIKHLQCLIRGETSLSPTSRLFFNSLLVAENASISTQCIVGLRRLTTP